MLIVIAGITGLIGRECAVAALQRKHQVRGLGRSPKKLDPALKDKIESFVTTKDVYDISALEKGVAGVDAVVCAYNWHPTAVLDGQLLLLRAAERAGVKIFHAASWNYDWTTPATLIGEHEAYDPFIAFRAQARISSPIKPLYMMTGILVDHMFTRPGAYDPTKKALMTMGPSDKVHRWTTARNMGEYTIEAVTMPGAAEGGVLYVQSFEASWDDVLPVYKAARPGAQEMTVQNMGTADDAERMRAGARAQIDPVNHNEYVGLGYAIHMARGTWDFEPVDSKTRFASVKQTTLKEWFEAHPEV